MRSDMRSLFLGALFVLLYFFGFGLAFYALPYIEQPGGVSAVNERGAPIMRAAKLYFPTSASMAETTDCIAYTSVTRMVPDTSDALRASIELLLEGPSETEKKAGFQTSIPAGTKLMGVDVRDGVARLQFNQALDEGVAGSCMVGMIRSQIEQTAQQFSGIQQVVLSIDGRTEDVLQP